MKYRVIYNGKQIEYRQTKREAQALVREVGYSAGAIRLQHRVGDKWQTIEQWS